MCWGKLLNSHRKLPSVIVVIPECPRGRLPFVECTQSARLNPWGKFSYHARKGGEEGRRRSTPTFVDRSERRSKPISELLLPCVGLVLPAFIAMGIPSIIPECRRVNSLQILPASTFPRACAALPAAVTADAPPATSSAGAVRTSKFICWCNFSFASLITCAQASKPIFSRGLHVYSSRILRDHSIRGSFFTGRH